MVSLVSQGLSSGLQTDRPTLRQVEGVGTALTQTPGSNCTLAVVSLSNEGQVCKDRERVCNMDTGKHTLSPPSNHKGPILFSWQLSVLLRLLHLGAAAFFTLLVTFLRQQEVGRLASRARFSTVGVE